MESAEFRRRKEIVWLPSGLRFNRIGSFQRDPVRGVIINWILGKEVHVCVGVLLKSCGRFLSQFFHARNVLR